MIVTATYENVELSISLATSDGLKSNNEAVFEYVVRHINDAPVLPPGATSIAAVSIMEDDYLSIGKTTSVSSIVAQMGATDPDFPLGGGTFGIAVVGSDQTNGDWQYTLDGIIFKSFDGVMDSAAVLLDESAAIRFVPNRDFHETPGVLTPALTFAAWDQTQFASGDSSIDILSVDQITGPFSVTDRILEIHVSPVNDAPVVVSGATLDAIDEDDVESIGTRISSFVGPVYSDVDNLTSTLHDAYLGIAVTGVDRRFGEWRYKCPPSMVFRKFIGGVLSNGQIFPRDPSPAKATLLSGDCVVRFEPDTDFNTLADLNGQPRSVSDMPWIKFYGWDRTAVIYNYVALSADDGLSSIKERAFETWPGEVSVDVTDQRGDTDTFSSNEVAATISVNSINDAPALSLGLFDGGFETLMIEGNTSVSIVKSCPKTPQEWEDARITKIDCVNMTDSDHSTVTSMTYTITNVQNPGYESIIFEGVNSNILSSTDTCVDDRAGGEWRDELGFTCSWYNEDVSRCNARRRRDTIECININSGSVLGSGIGINEHTTDQPTTAEGVTTTDQPTTAEPTTDEPTTAESLDKWTDSAGFDCDWYAEDTKRCSKYVEVGNAFGLSSKDACCVCGGGERSAALRAADMVGQGGMSIRMKFKGVDLDDFSLEDVAAIKTQVKDAVERNTGKGSVLRVSLKPSSDTRRIREIGSKAGVDADVKLDPSVDPAAASEATESACLVSVQTPSGDSYVASGCILLTAAEVDAQSSNTKASDACCACGGGNKGTHGQTVIYSSADSSWLLRAVSSTVPTVSGYKHETILTRDRPVGGYILNTRADRTSGCPYGDGESYVHRSGGERLGGGACRTMLFDGFYELLTTARYQNVDGELSNATRVITVEMNDGTAKSTKTTIVDVQLRTENAPVIVIRKPSYDFTEGQNALPIADTIEFYDNDHNEFYRIAEIRVSTVGAIRDGDELSFSSHLTLSAIFNSSTGVALLTGSGSVNEYRNSLQSLKFFNGLDEMEPGVRTFAVRAMDSNGAKSAVQLIQVAVLPINDQVPRVNANADYVLLEDRSETVEFYDSIELFDADAGNLDNEYVTITIKHPLNGQDEVLQATGEGQVTVTWDSSSHILRLQGPAKVADFNRTLKSLLYINYAEEPIGEQRILAFEAYDGLNTGTSTGTVKFDMINDRPVVSVNSPGVARIYHEGNAGTALFDATVISDNDHTTLTSVYIRLDPSYPDTEAEVIILPSDVTSTSISVSSSTNGGDLRLSGEASINDYQALVRRVMYMHHDAKPGNPTPGQRTVYITAYDGESVSIEQSVSVNVIAVNDAPIVQNIISVNFIEDNAPVLITNSNSLILTDVDSVDLSYVLIYISVVDESQRNFGYEHLMVDLRSDKLSVANSSETCVAVCNAKGNANNCKSLCQLFKDIPLASDLSTSCTDACIGSNDGNCMAACDTGRASDGSLLISGVSSVETYFEVLQTVTYINDKDEPTYAIREINLVASDGLNVSLTAQSSVNIIGVNDIPRIWLAQVAPSAQSRYEPTEVLLLSFVEGSRPLELFDTSLSIIVEDDDSTMLGSLTAVLTDVKGSPVDTRYEGLYRNDLPHDVDGAFLNEYDKLSNGEFGLQPGDEWRASLTTTITTGKKSVADMELLIRSLRYVNLNHNPENDGQRQIKIIATDDKGASSVPVYVNITVIAVNDPPLSQLATLKYDLIEDAGVLNMDVLAVFFDDFDRPLASDPPMANATIIVTKQPEYGDVTVSGVVNSVLIFNQVMHDYGKRTFYIKVCDAGGLCSREWPVEISIAPVNDAPYPVSDPLLFSMVEDTVAIISLDHFYFDVEDYRREPFHPSIDGANLTSVSMPLIQPDLVYELSLDATLKTVEVKPMKDFSGNFTIEFIVCDSVSACTEMNLIVQVSNTNDAPYVGLSTLTINEDTDTIVDLQVHDAEDDIAGVLVNITQAPAHGSATVHLRKGVGLAPSKWEFAYSPSHNYAGDDTVLFTATDKRGGTSTVSLIITITPVEDPPEIRIPNLNVTEDVTSSWPVKTLVYDPEDQIDFVKVRVAGQATFGDVVYDHITGIISYTAYLNYVGADSFTLEVCTDADGCVMLSFSVNVLAVNDIPVLNTISHTIDEDSGIITIELWSTITDVDDSKIDLKAGISLPYGPKSTLGSAVYDVATGRLSYTPDADAFGTDFITYESCDTKGGCSRGNVTFTIRPINDPPRLLQSYLDMVELGGYVVDEDVENLVQGYEGIYTDPEVALTVRDTNGEVMLKDASGISTAPALSIEITSHPDHGTATIFSNTGKIGYLPKSNYVGDDVIGFTVCDACADARNAELGRLHSNPDPACQREREAAAATKSVPGCLSINVTLMVVNVNDKTTAVDLSTVIKVGEAAAIVPLASVFDVDDTQRQQLIDIGLDPVKYGLSGSELTDTLPGGRITHEIVQSSLILTETKVPVHGSVEKTADNTFVYRPTPTVPGFAGYDTFTYGLCEISGSCSEGTVHVRVVIEAPRIIQIRAIAGCHLSSEGLTFDELIADDECIGYLETDSKYGAGDKFMITFDQATNMPPYGQAMVQFPRKDVDAIISSSEPFVAESEKIKGIGGYVGVWRDSRTLFIYIEEVGYPEPAVSEDIQISVAGAGRQCGAFDSTSMVYTPIDTNSHCLTDAAGLSEHSQATSAGLTMIGTFGHTLGQITELALTNPIDYTASFFGIGSVVDLEVQPPLSAEQLYVHCNKGATEIFDLTKFGEGVQGTVECSSILEDRTLIPRPSNEEYGCAYTPELLSADALLKCPNTLEVRMEQAPVSMPVASLFVLTITAIGASNVDPTQQSKFATNTVDAWKLAADVDGLRKRRATSSTALAETVVSTTGFGPATVYTGTADSYDVKNEDLLDNSAASFFRLGYNQRTPELVEVTALGVGKTLSELTLRFSIDTNVPSDGLTPQGSSDFTITRDGIDRLLSFNPPLGPIYYGQWSDRTHLTITIDSVSPNMTSYPNIEFVGATDVRGNPTGSPCRGSNLCGTEGDSWGVCDLAEQSCRASGTWPASKIVATASSSLLGSADLSVESTAVSNTTTLMVIIIIVCIGLPLVLLLVWRFYRKDAEKQEVERVLKQWKSKKTSWEPGARSDASEVWSRPPAMVAMRTNPDPFLSMATDSGTKSMEPRAPATIPEKASTGTGNKVAPMALPPLKSLPPGLVKPSRAASDVPSGAGTNAARKFARASVGGIVGQKAADPFSMARRTSNSNIAMAKAQDPFARADGRRTSFQAEMGGGPGSRPSMGMPRRPSFAGAAQFAGTANRTANAFASGLPPPRMPGMPPGMSSSPGGGPRPAPPGMGPRGPRPGPGLGPMGVAGRVNAASFGGRPMPGSVRPGAPGGPGGGFNRPGGGPPGGPGGGFNRPGGGPGMVRPSVPGPRGPPLPGLRGVTPTTTKPDPFDGGSNSDSNSD